MSTRDREPEHLEALRAERDRLDIVTDVLSDMFRAAGEVANGKGYRDCAAEDAKQAHWAQFRKPALAEYFAAADAYSAARFGTEFVEESRAKREHIFAGDPEMHELIVKARADLAARHQSAPRPERDRRRSR